LAGICGQAYCQNLLPIPAPPNPPSLPIPLNSGSYFLFGWNTTVEYGVPSVDINSVPFDARTRVSRFSVFAGGGYVLKTNGEMILFSGFAKPPGQAAGGGPSKLIVPEFCRSNIVKVGVPIEPQANGYRQLVLASSGQLGVLYGPIGSWTNSLNLRMPESCSNVVNFYINKNSSSRFLSLHVDRTMRVWDVGNDGLLTELSHPAASLTNIVAAEGSANLGFTLNGEGGAQGWQLNSFNNQVENLPIPLEAASGIVQISAPSEPDALNNIYYALKSDGSILCWDSTGTKLDLPSSFQGKQFVKVVGGFAPGRQAFALTRQGEILGWEYPTVTAGMESSPRVPQEIQLPFAGPTFKQIAASQYPLSFGDTGKSLVALNENGGLFVLIRSFGPIPGWQIYQHIPAPIRAGKTRLEDIHLSDQAPAGMAGSYVLSTDSDLAVQSYIGFPLEVLAELVAEKIRNHPQNFGISTQINTQSAITDATSNFITPSEITGLATKAELTASLAQSRTDGINSVLSNPNLWTLYTTSQIQGMAIGDLVLTRTNGGGFVLNYDIEQSEDLVNWTPYQGFAMPLTNLPTNKAFVRIKAKQ